MLDCSRLLSLESRLPTPVCASRCPRYLREYKFLAVAALVVEFLSRSLINLCFISDAYNETP